MTTPGLGAGRFFATTHWSVVLNAADSSAPGAEEALEKLCRAYWDSLYAYVRREEHSPEDAQDLTQSFFARLLEKDYLAQVAREKGRFRSFLLVALRGAEAASQTNATEEVSRGLYPEPTDHWDSVEP